MYCISYVVASLWFTTNNTYNAYTLLFCKFFKAYWKQKLIVSQHLCHCQRNKSISIL